MKPIPMDKPLLVAGALLFLLGLLQGAATDLYLNPRMALSAHLTAVQSGMAMMLAGGIWSAVTLGPILSAATRWSIMASMFALWAALSLAAATGASEALPIAGTGFAAGPFLDSIVSTMVLLSSAAMVVGWALLLIGLLRAKA